MNGPGASITSGTEFRSRQPEVKKDIKRKSEGPKTRLGDILGCLDHNTNPSASTCQKIKVKRNGGQGDSLALLSTIRDAGRRRRVHKFRTNSKTQLEILDDSMYAITKEGTTSRQDQNSDKTAKLATVQAVSPDLVTKHNSE
jgi:hypothetical protein